MSDAGRYVKKQMTVEAVQFDGTTAHAVALQRWLGGKPYEAPDMRTFDNRAFSVPTKLGRTWAYKGDWVVKNPVDDEFYPIKDEDFVKLYTPEMDDLRARAKRIAAAQQGVLDHLAPND